MSEIELDPELLSDFIVESRELLDEFSSNLIELETKPQDTDLIGAIFRAAHTLKGSSAFFNLVHIKNFAHKLENLLDDLRNKRRTVTSEAVDLLLTGGNHLKSMFDRVQSGDYSTVLSAEEDNFLSGLIDHLEKQKKAPTPAEILRAVRILTAEFQKTGLNPENVIQKIHSLLADLPVDGVKMDTVPSEAPPGEAATPKPVRSFYTYQGVDLSGPVHEALTLLDAAESSGKIDDKSYLAVLRELEDIFETHNLEPLKKPLEEAIEDLQAILDSSMDFDQLLISLTKDKFGQVIDLLESIEGPAAAAGPETEQETPETRPEGAVAPRPKKPEEKIERKTMRIDEDKVDGFMNYIGELIVTSESFNYLQKMIEKEKVNPLTLKAFKNANQAFRELSDELQDSLMEIRRIPIKNLLQKTMLMARELSHQMGKQVKVQIDGQEVQVDKSIAEGLEGPLLHVVRNSLDHGLEPPGDREAGGKEPEGLLKIAASADKEFFYLDVIDDGRGISPRVMRETAIKKGLLTEAQAEAMSDKEAVGLVFGAGFSTAQTITDVSGRGVGMDVVRTNIQKLNGTINIDSEVGQGTAIALKIPLSVTLQVIKALLVRVGQEHFIISLDAILESLRPEPKDLSTVEGRGEIINRRGRILPLLRLYELFNLTPEHTNPATSILVIIETAKGRYALMVDEVLGQQQVVVKELDTHFKNLSFIAGSATLGDGRLGLVLEAEGLLHLAHGLT